MADSSQSFPVARSRRRAVIPTVVLVIIAIAAVIETWTMVRDLLDSFSTLPNYLRPWVPR